MYKKKMLTSRTKITGSGLYAWFDSTLYKVVRNSRIKLFVNCFLVIAIWSLIYGCILVSVLYNVRNFLFVRFVFVLGKKNLIFSFRFVCSSFYCFDLSKKIYAKRSFLNVLILPFRCSWWLRLRCSLKVVVVD